MNAEFEVHLLNELGIQKAQELAAKFDTLLTDIKKIVPASRYLSIVATKLEEASFFAKKGMAVNPIHQKE